MPIFEYHCTGCGRDFEKILKAGELVTVPCPACGSTKTEKKVSIFSGGATSSHSCDSGG